MAQTMSEGATDQRRPKSTNRVALTAAALVGGSFLTIVIIRGSFRRFTF